MRFYTQQHQYYCGIDLRARSMYLCILDQSGEILLHRNMRANPNAFLKAVAPFFHCWLGRFDECRKRIIDDRGRMFRHFFRHKCKGSA